MNIKQNNSRFLISAVAVSVLVISGCTTQTNKPPAGTGYTGPLVDGAGSSTAQNGGSGGGNSTSGGRSGGSAQGGGGSGGAGSGRGGTGSGSGFGGGVAQGNVPHYGHNQGGGSAGGSYGNNTPGLGGSNSSYGSGRGAGQGGFGSGSAYGGNTKSSYTPADLRDPRSILAQRVIYFDYDKSTIRPEYRKVLDAHGSLLADFPQLNVRLEGHADERGSREYNVALSERRAYSVLDYLKIKGVKATQADIVGYGEEVPAQFGHGEGSWSKNRRVEIIYAGE